MLTQIQRVRELLATFLGFGRDLQQVETLCFFRAAPEVIKTLQARVASNALELARQGAPKAPFYLTGQVGGQPFSNGRKVLRRNEMQSLRRR
jgi:hypothetical protein